MLTTSPLGSSAATAPNAIIAPATGPRSIAPITARPGDNRAAARRRWLLSVFMETPRLRQRLVDDGERLVALDDRDGRQAKLAAKLIGGHDHGTRRRRATRSGLRERRRQRGVEGHVAFDLLGELMDVAIENRDRAEALQQVERALAVLGAPAPLFVE